MNNDYLFDGSGEPDTEVQQLEALLGRYRSSAPMPDFRRVAMMRPHPRWPFAIAAALLLVAIIGALRIYTPPNRWRATSASGGAVVPHFLLRAGDIVRTGAQGSVRLESPAVGMLDIRANTTVKLIESRRNRHRLALTAGSIHARTTSMPGVFVIDTPRARAIDLGCEYTLTVSPDGAGELRVISGWVDLSRGFEQSLVPQGASALMTADGELTVPVFDDAAPRFRAAVRDFARGHDLATIVSLARKRDALTLLNLFRLTTPEESVILFDRLNQLVPAPDLILRDSVRNWRPDVTELWWRPILRATGLNVIKKKKGMLDGL
jgi:ferric-dicitrate binding protein FerR (iron transport regulator)